MNIRYYKMYQVRIATSVGIFYAHKGTGALPRVSWVLGSDYPDLFTLVEAVEIQRKYSDQLPILHEVQCQEDDS